MAKQSKYFIKEPKGVDLIVAPSVLTDNDRRLISATIAAYKRTGKLPSKSSLLRRRGKSKVPLAKN